MVTDLGLPKTHKTHKMNTLNPFDENLELSQGTPNASLLKLLRPLLLLAVSACTVIDPATQHNQFIEISPNSPVENYVKWAKGALRAWDIDLKASDVNSRIRNVTPGYAANPPNWITVSDENCRSKGLLPEMRGSQCQFQDAGVVGYCLLRGYQSGPKVGQIIDSTIIIRKSALETTTTEIQRRSIFVHEVGHCLGLQHWGNADNMDSALEPDDLMGGNKYKEHIMYPILPDTSATSIPHHSREKDAVKAVYAHNDKCNSKQLTRDCQNPMALSNSQDCHRHNGNRSGTDYSTYENYLPCYYSQVLLGSEKTVAPNNQRFYHIKFPRFHVSAGIGNAVSYEAMPLRGAPLESSEIVSLIYLYHSDGSESIYRKNSFSKKYK